MGITERKEREKEIRRESIIDAAQKVFFEKGLFASTMDEIAETAELSKGTLYLYYRSKEDLYLTVMMRGLDILRQRMEEIVRRDEPAVRRMLDLTEMYTRFFDEHRNYFRMLHFFNTPQFHKQVSDDVMRSCDTNNRSLWELMIGVIRSGMDEGAVRTDLDPMEVALIMWSSATTLLMRIDNQYDLFRTKLNIDLHNTLRVSNLLLLESALTDAGRGELHAAVHH